MIQRLPFRLVPLLVLGAVGLWLARAPDTVSTDATPQPATPRYALTGASWIKLDARGQPQFRAQAAQIDFYDDSSARLQVLSVDALGGLESHWRLNAPTGYLPAQQQRLWLDGPITGEGRLAADEWVQLRAEQLWIDMAKRELGSERPVRLVSPRKQAQAQGLRADFKGSRVELRGQVETRYDPG